MRTHRNSHTEIPEQKKIHQLNHDRPDPRQPGNPRNKINFVKTRTAIEIA